MLKILSYAAAFAAGAVVTNESIREGIQITASDSLHSAAAMVRPKEEGDGPAMGGPYGTRSELPQSF
jgi:hypothetical protein